MICILALSIVNEDVLDASSYWCTEKKWATLSSHNNDLPKETAVLVVASAQA